MEKNTILALFIPKDYYGKCSILTKNTYAAKAAGSLIPFLHETRNPISIDQNKSTKVFPLAYWFTIIFLVLMPVFVFR